MLLNCLLIDIISYIIHIKCNSEDAFDTNNNISKKYYIVTILVINNIFGKNYRNFFGTLKYFHLLIDF